VFPKRMDLLERWRLSVVRPHVRGRLLDIGCGYNNLVRDYGSGIGVDSHVWEGIDVQIGDAAALPFDDDSFDTATVVAALNHIPNRTEALKEIRRVLRSNGTLLVTMIGPVTGYIAHVLFRQDETRRGGSGTGEVNGMCRREVRDIVSQAGFSLIDEHPFQLGLNTLFVATKCSEKPAVTQKVSIIIPVYNEQSTFGEVVTRVSAVELPGVEKEIVIADDGSQDDSPSIIASMRDQNPSMIRVHTSAANVGKGAAIRCGLECATGDVVLIQDADLELKPEEYPALLGPILRGEADVVYGSRFRRRARNIPLHTRLGNRCLTLFTNLLYGSSLTDMETAYKVFRSGAIKSLRLESTRFEFEPEVTAKLLLAGHKIREVPISYNPRSVAEGKKVGWIDGIECLWTLLKCRFLGSREGGSRPRR
jgi:hypothetical protein